MTKIQKTLLGLLATTTALSAFAGETKEGNFYLQGSLGVFLQNKASNPFKDLKDADKAALISTGNTFSADKVKNPSMAFDMAIGAGYYVMDNFRVELVYSKPFINSTKVGCSETGDNNAAPAVQVTYKNPGKVKLNINSVQLRGYFDLVDISDMGKLYVGAGVGVSNITGKLNIDARTVGAATATTPALTAQDAKKYKFKSTNNFTYVLALGAEFDVADNTKLGLEYNFADYGKVKTKDFDYKTSVRGHSVMAKLRFDI